MSHHFFSRTFLLLLGLGLLGTSSCSKDELTPADPLGTNTTQQATSASLGTATLRSHHYIIIASGDRLPADIAAQTKAAKGTVTALLSEVGLAMATSDDPGFATQAAKIAGVRSVVRDFRFRAFDPAPEQGVALDAAYGNPPSSGDDDKLFDLQWGHNAINAPEAWTAGYRGNGSRVAVLDNGFDIDHPDLAPNIDVAASRSFVAGEGVEYALPDRFSHGTHVAGTIAAADNGLGIIGVAPEAKLILVKVLSDKGSGSFSDVISGIVHAVREEADVINMSLGALIPRNGRFLDDNGTPNDPSDDFIVREMKTTQELIVAISKATTYAHQQGVTLIAAAGNESINGNRDGNLVTMPADAPHVIAISATAPRGWALNPTAAFLDHLASYSNYGTPEIDLAAPGGDFSYSGFERATIAGITRFVRVFDLVYSTGSLNSYYWSAGTSMAAPHACGVAALVIGKNGGEMAPTRVEAVLRASADDLGKPGRDPSYGHGRVNAERAVAAVQ